MGKSLTRVFAGMLCAVMAPASFGQAHQPSGAQQSQQAQQAPQTVASTVDREVSTIEKLVVDAAEAMPEDKFNFSPESLGVTGSEQRRAHVCRGGEAHRHLELVSLVADHWREDAGRVEGWKQP